ncbi:MAG: zinc ribbon domain-containing protein [Gemmatimonadetes bacterium]|nr:zinc ribbon domain-containing protein [Gemmatimonadota bacterium]
MYISSSQSGFRGAYTVKCPSCGANASGKFCSNCGANLGGNACSSCGASLSAGAKFCHACGAPAAGGAVRERSGSMPWVVAGGAVVALLVVLAITRLGPAGGGRPAAGPPPVGGGPAIDISAMTPRERADRLFNRVVSSAERGQLDTARFFTPMALAAYAMLGPLDEDARYHVGLIHLVNDEFDATLAQADSIAEVVLGHLLAAILRAQVAEKRGDDAALARARRAFLDSWQSESTANRPEYQQHQGLIDRFRNEIIAPDSPGS